MRKSCPLEFRRLKWIEICRHWIIKQLIFFGAPSKVCLSQKKWRDSKLWILCIQFLLLFLVLRCWIFNGKQNKNIGRNRDLSKICSQWIRADCKRSVDCIKLRLFVHLVPHYLQKMKAWQRLPKIGGLYSFISCLILIKYTPLQSYEKRKK